jgi:hypothetical protein
LIEDQEENPYAEAPEEANQRREKRHRWNQSVHNRQYHGNEMGQHQEHKQAGPHQGQKRRIFEAHGGSMKPPRGFCKQSAQATLSAQKFIDRKPGTNSLTTGIPNRGLVKFTR